MKKLSGFIILITFFATFFTSCKKSDQPISLEQMNSIIVNIITDSTSIFDISSNTVTINTNIISDGGNEISERGIAYDTLPNPTIENNTVFGGTGIGSFTCILKELTEGFVYYARAYATNSSGTAYGNQIILSTKAKPPTVTDFDGNVYHVVTIGTQTWMVENLKTTKYRDGTPIPNITNPSTWKTLTTGARTSYNNTGVNAGIYGQLYNWYAVNNSHKLAPVGWHIPSHAEWNTLISYLGGVIHSGGKLKEVSAKNWQRPNKGATNSTGFTGLPGGCLGSAYFSNLFGLNFEFRDLGTDGGWWSSTAPWLFSLTYSNDDAFNLQADLTAGFSVRCILDGNLQVNTELTTANITSIKETTAVSGGNITNTGIGPITARGVCYSTNPNPTIANSISPGGTGIGIFTVNISGLIPNTTYYVRAFATNSGGTAYGKSVRFSTQALGPVTDCDGNIYHTVAIGSQVWMIENLKTTKYRDCSPIPNVTDNIAWSELTTGAYSNYDNDGANANTYGRLYNWFAATDFRNIAPVGWHVPNNADWDILTNYLGGVSVAGGAMKNQTGWILPNSGATNSSGFTGLPGGSRGWNANPFYSSFDLFGTSGLWWSSDDDGTGNVWYRFLVNSNTYLWPGLNQKGNGFSIRCIKD